MREQSGFGTPLSLELAGYQQGSSVGHYAGLHPEDAPSSTNDVYSRRTIAHREHLYDDQAKPRLPSSTRRYGTTIQQATPKSIIRVTRHQGPPPIQARASRSQPQTEEPETSPSVKRRQPRRQVHWFVYVGLCLCIMLIGWMLIGALASWLQVVHDNMQYGTPRTFQCDADVGHGGISHFTVVNLHGHILITEVQVDHPEKSRLYTGPVLSGPGSDLVPATVSFEDMNKDGSPDMVLNVENTNHVYYNNTKDGFQMASNG